MPAKTSDKSKDKKVAVEKQPPTKRTRSSTMLFTKGRKLPLVQRLKNNDFIKVYHDSLINDLVAERISADDAHLLTRELHPPRVISIRHDPNHVILFLWDVSRNQYDLGETVSITDPRLPQNQH